MIGNAFITWLLTSPAHGLLSNNMAVLHVNGIKTDNLYTVPVNYIQIEDKLTIISHTDRTWWRNLVGGATLSLELRGENVSAYGTVLRNPDDAEEALAECIHERPGMARVLGIALRPDGTAYPTELRRAVGKHIVIQLHLGVAAYQPG